MSVENFIPEIWSSRLIVALRAAHVYAQPQVSNSDYEGEIRGRGDTVRITTVSRPTISDYDPSSTTVTPEDLSTAQRTLTITEDKHFAFQLDDLDKAQTLPGLMEQAMSEAAFGLSDVADGFLAAMYTQVASANQLGTVGVAVGSPTAAYDSLLVPLKVKLDEANVPATGRYCVVPPWLHGRMLRDDRFVKVGDAGTSEGLRNGMVGRAAGFDILLSNKTPNPTSDHNVVLAGVSGALSYAEQIREVEAYRSQAKFADVVRGRHVYGGKMLRPEMAATAIADPTP